DCSILTNKSTHAKTVLDLFHLHLFLEVQHIFFNDAIKECRERDATREEAPILVFLLAVWRKKEDRANRAYCSRL
ncbi:MAG: hypothetical protein R2738_11660, partial [Bacteroides graminisolvens]